MPTLDELRAEMAAAKARVDALGPPVPREYQKASSDYYNAMRKFNDAEARQISVALLARLVGRTITTVKVKYRAEPPSASKLGDERYELDEDTLFVLDDGTSIAMHASGEDSGYFIVKLESPLTLDAVDPQVGVISE